MECIKRLQYFALLFCFASSKVESFQHFSTIGDFLKIHLKSSPLTKQKSRDFENKVSQFSPLLFRGAPMPMKSGYKVPNPSLGNVIESCGGSDQVINITSLSLKPDPIYFPGVATIGFAVVFQEDISADAKLNGSLVLELMERSGQFIKIPCIGNIGSCSYNDICGMMQAIQQCPPEFLDNNIPCRCPFNKGKYKLDDLSVEIDASVFLPGTYRATVKINDDNKGQLGCYVLNFTIG